MKLGKKKICIIHKVPALDPRSFYKQARSLSKNGCEVTLMSLHDEEGIFDSVRLVRFSPPKKRLVRFIKSNWDVFKRALKEKADVYHFHDLDFVPWAAILKVLSRKKIIYDIHEAHPEYMLIKPYIPKYFKSVVSILVYAVEHIGCLFFDAIITNDNFVLQNFHHKNKDVIYNFPLLDFFEPNIEVLPYEKRPYDIIFIGSLPQWHFSPMLDISAILKKKGYQVRWLLLPAKDAPRQSMISQIRERGLSDYFTVEESVPFTSVPQYLFNSRIGIITIPPYKKYLKNIPLKMFEYMGCGLPIIASDLPPTRQFVDGENCAILVEHAPEAYANAIISLLDNPKKAEEMGRKGKTLVFQRYNWSSEERRLIELYENLLNH